MADQDQSPFPSFARPVNLPASAPFKFSICTLVTRPEEYAAMAASFVRAGFAPDDTEFLFINNTNAKQLDAYRGYNLFLQTARGEFIVLCHQDILLNHDRREILEQRIRELDALDPAWALLGNAGCAQCFGLQVTAIKISHPSGSETIGKFPTRVDSLDENFIVVKRTANLALSHDLSGFHFYGTDLCRIAKILGRTAYVVDFHLLHKSLGKYDDSFFQSRQQLVKKYQRALSGRLVFATTGPVRLTGNALASWWFNSGRREFLFAQIYRRRREVSDEVKKMQQELGAGWYVLYWCGYKIKQPFIKIRARLGRNIFGA
jgi:hypothetical protein